MVEQWNEKMPKPIIPNYSRFQFLYSVFSVVSVVNNF